MTTERKNFYRLLQPGQWMLRDTMKKDPAYSERALIWGAARYLIHLEVFQDRQYVYRRTTDEVMAGTTKFGRYQFPRIDPPITCIQCGNVLYHVDKHYECRECKFMYAPDQGFINENQP